MLYIVLAESLTVRLVTECVREARCALKRGRSIIQVMPCNGSCVERFSTKFAGYDAAQYRKPDGGTHTLRSASHVLTGSRLDALPLDSSWLLPPPVGSAAHSLPHQTVTPAPAPKNRRKAKK